MVSIMEMVVNQYVFRFFLENFGLFGIEEKVLGNPSRTQTHSAHIDPERGRTERLTEYLFVPKYGSVLENMLLEFVINIIVVAVAAKPHNNSIYIFDRKIIAKQNLINSMFRLEDTGTIKQAHIFQFAQG